LTHTHACNAFWHKGKSKGAKGKVDEEEKEKARESVVQELLRVADRFQTGGAVCAFRN
jgi:hypothetical protein